MTLASGYGNNWGYIDGNAFTARPANAFGQSYVLGANHTKGSWQSLLTTTEDCFALYINFNSLASSASARNRLADIGIDTSGGSSYTPLINNLICMSSPFNILCGGVEYYFPLYIPAGSSIAVRGQTSHTASETGYCAIIVYGRPSKPDRIVYGHAVETLGVDTATSLGTSVTATSSASFGSYTTIGTTTRNWKHFQIGWGINNATITALFYRIDIAKGSNNERLVLDNVCTPTTSEQLSLIQDANSYFNIPSGIDLKAHIWCSSTAVTGQHIGLYGVY